MGHLINPVGLRLKIFNNWLDVWMTNSSYYYAELLHCSFRGKKILMYYMENMITDKYGILYSHMTMQEINKHTVFNVYFYDGLIEQKLQKLTKQVRKYNIKTRIFEYKFRNNFLKKVYSSKNKFFFLKKIGFYNFFLFRKIFLFFFFFLINFLKKKKILFALKKKIKKFYSFFSIFWRINLRIKKNYCNNNNKYDIFFFIRFFKNFLSKFLNFYFYKNKSLILKKETINLNFFYFFLKELYNIWFIKTKYFKLYLFYKKILYSIKYNYYLNYLNQINDFVLIFVIYFLRIYLLNFRQRIFFKIYFYILKPLLQYISPYPVILEFFGLDNDTITASFLARYLTRKIEMRFSIRELFKPILRELKLLRKFTKILYSFKIQFIGRITRRDRVITKWVQVGGIPYSTTSCIIEHSLYTGFLRNGVCCLRVWFYRPKYIGNYNYLYRYIIQESVLKKIFLKRFYNKK